jgi:hypothetical protein
MADGAIDTRTARVTAEEALHMHASGRPGKLETRISKPITTARDLSLAYSPGVAEPCLHIARDPSLAYDYTTKGNMVAVLRRPLLDPGFGGINLEENAYVQHTRGGPATSCRIARSPTHPWTTVAATAAAAVPQQACRVDRPRHWRLNYRANRRVLWTTA